MLKPILPSGAFFTDYNITLFFINEETYGYMATKKIGCQNMSIINLNRNIIRKTNILLCFVFIQIGLGIVTLLSYVTIHVAIAHQLGSLVLFTISIWILKSLPLVSK